MSSIGFDTTAAMNAGADPTAALGDTVGTLSPTLRGTASG